MVRRRLRHIVTVVAVVVLAVGASLAVTGGGPALAASRASAAATVPTFANGQIAYGCRGGAGDVWYTAGADGSHPVMHPWPWGNWYGPAHWSADGSEMVHIARYSSPPSATTVFLSEADASYPWLDTNFSKAVVDDQTPAFTHDGKRIVFARNTSGIYRIVEIYAGGWDPPFEIPQPDGQNLGPDTSVNGDITFWTHNGVTADTVWILKAGASAAVAVGPGMVPKFSPDGTKIAFENGATGFLSEMNLDGSGVTTIGPDLGFSLLNDYTWSPDGTKLLLGYYTTVVESPVLPAGGSGTTLTKGANCDELWSVSWQPVPTVHDQVVRAYGQTREGTAIAVSEKSFPTDHTADAVVLADSQHFPDALSGTPLAVKVHGPMLLTPGAQPLPLTAVTDEIARVLKPAAKKIYILGGTGSVSQGIEDALSSAGYTIQRFAGINRYETSLQIAQFLGEGASAPEELLLATGTDFPDGLSAGAAAASYWTGANPDGGAVLLTNGGALTSGTKAYIDAAIAAHTDPAHKVYVTTVGGLADKAYRAPDRIPCVGADRYETSECVAEEFFGAQSNIGLATGLSFPDALSGGVFAGMINAPMLLIPSSLLTSNLSPYWLHVTSAAISTAYVFGGTGVVSSTQLSQVRAIIGLNTDYVDFPATSAASAARTSSARTSLIAKDPPRIAAGRSRSTSTRSVASWSVAAVASEVR